MKWIGRTLLLGGAVLLAMQGLTATAAPPAAVNAGGGPAVSAATDRQALVKEILGMWENAPNPVNARNEAQYPDLRAALKAATTEQLRDAQGARTLDDLWAALPKGARSPIAVVPLAAGRTITPLVLGDTTDDLVFTPVTPCRIIDTRGGDVNHTGLLGPNSGRQFFVAGTDYSSEGGFAGSCGIPTSPLPAAVMINVTSTGQTGPGNLRAIITGGGVPNTSLVNYVAGVNIANAAAVASYTGSTTANIYLYSGNSQSHAVVDILGYFSPPAVSPVGRAYATVAHNAFVAARTKNFSAVSNPSTGVYCLSTAVDVTNTPILVTVEWGASSGNILSAYVQTSNPAFSCSAGQVEVQTYNPDNTLSNSVAFNVWIP
jgi:hypothetical protein